MITITVSLITSAREGQLTFKSSDFTSFKNITGLPLKSGFIGLGSSIIIFFAGPAARVSQDSFLNAWGKLPS